MELLFKAFSKKSDPLSANYLYCRYPTYELLAAQAAPIGRGSVLSSVAISVPEHRLVAKTEGKTSLRLVYITGILSIRY